MLNNLKLINMKFHEAIIKLYSKNLIEILEVLNKSIHFDNLPQDKNQIGVHTGFFFYSHKKNLFELIYCIETENFYYQFTNSELLPLGAQMQVDDVMFARSRFVKMRIQNKNYFVFNGTIETKRLPYYWYESYNVETNIFNLQLISAESANMALLKNKILDVTLSYQTGLLMNSFNMMIYNQNKSIRLITPPINTFYMSGGKFSIRQ